MDDGSVRTLASDSAATSSAVSGKPRFSAKVAALHSSDLQHPFTCVLQTDEQIIFAGDASGRILRFKPGEPTTIYAGHTGTVTDLAAVDDGSAGSGAVSGSGRPGVRTADKGIVSVGSDGVLCFWDGSGDVLNPEDVAPPQPLSHLVAKFGNPAACAAAAAAAADNASADKPPTVPTVPDFPGLRCVVTAAGGTSAFCGGSDGSLIRFDLADAESQNSAARDVRPGGDGAELSPARRARRLVPGTVVQGAAAPAEAREDDSVSTARAAVVGLCVPPSRFALASLDSDGTVDWWQAAADGVVAAATTRRPADAGGAWRSITASRYASLVFVAGSGGQLLGISAETTLVELVVDLGRPVRHLRSLPGRKALLVGYGTNGPSAREGAYLEALDETSLLEALGSFLRSRQEIFGTEKAALTNAAQEMIGKSAARAVWHVKKARSQLMKEALAAAESTLLTGEEDEYEAHGGGGADEEDEYGRDGDAEEPAAKEINEGSHNIPREVLEATRASVEESLHVVIADIRKKYTEIVSTNAAKLERAIQAKERIASRGVLRISSAFLGAYRSTVHDLLPPSMSYMLLPCSVSTCCGHCLPTAQYLLRALMSHRVVLPTLTTLMLWLPI